MTFAPKTAKTVRLRSVAHVGWTSTSDDRIRLIEAWEWMNAHGFDFRSCRKSDWIDLSKGRDFLAEKCRYDAVLLHFLFRGGFCVDSRLVWTLRELKISPRASWGVWRRRLAQSGAKVIFAFGGFGEVNGTYLLNLDGYAVDVMNSDGMSVFVRKTT